MGMLRADGGKRCSAREFRVLEQLVKSGHSDKAIAEMIGRQENSVRSLRDYYGLTDPEKYKRTGAKFTPEEDKIINRRIRDWVQNERLTSKQMAQRLKDLHPPGLHFATVLTRIKKMDETGRLWKEHDKNDKRRRAQALRRRHIKGGCRTQQRDRGKFLPREKAT